MALRAKGKSYRDIADWINNTCKVEEPFSHMTVKSFLDNAPEIDVSMLTDDNEEREKIKEELWKLYWKIDRGSGDRTGSARAKILLGLASLVQETTKSIKEDQDNPLKIAENIENEINKLSKKGYLYSNPSTGKLSINKKLPHIKNDNNSTTT